MTRRELRGLLTVIVRQLMTNGSGDRADRLVLMRDEGPGRQGQDLGGLSAGTVVDRLTDHLAPYLTRGKDTTT
jgi:hypothetical protein